MKLWSAELLCLVDPRKGRRGASAVGNGICQLDGSLPSAEPLSCAALCHRR